MRRLKSVPKTSRRDALCDFPGMLLASLVLLLGTTTATALEVLGVESMSTTQEGPSLTLPQ